MFSYPDVLIAKLEVHLFHIIQIIEGSTFQGINPKDRMYIINDEINLMLALINGAKES